MKERKTDLFETIYEDDVDAICITTNGQYTRQGPAAMGGGCAGVCARRWPETASKLGKLLRNIGVNVPFVIGALDKDGEYLSPNRDGIRNKEYKCLIFSFPTINNIIDGSNLALIEQSTHLLKDYVDQFDLKGVMIPRPGCGIGSLDYYKDVRPILLPILDDRFTILCQEGDEFHE